jgi:HK97 family phage major capsid protein
MTQREIKGQWERTLQVERSAINPETRTVELALSSETPYERWFGMEILGHGPGEVDLSRLSNGAALLLGHDPDNQIGVVESCRLDSDRVLRCTVRFSRSAHAEEIFQDVLDGIRTKVSVGYMTSDYAMTKGENGGPDIYRFTGWTPYEASLVAIPADDAVGVGRSLEPEEAPNPKPPVAETGIVQEVRMDPITPATVAPDATTITRSDVMEALSLQTIADHNGLGREARELLSSEKPLAEVRSTLLDLISRSAKPIPVVDMTEKEAKSYSYARAILTAALRLDGEKIGGTFEDEIHQDLERKFGAKKGGILVPIQLRTAGTTLDSITSTAGTETKFTDYGGEIIDLLRNLTTVLRSGARVYNGLQGAVAFPKITADATVGWVAENPGSDLTATAPTFGSVTLSAKSMAGAIPYTRQFLNQSVMAVEAEVRRNLAAGHALALDRAALHGSGASNQPTGIYKTTSINTKAFGGVPTYDLLVDMETEVATDNALMGSLGWLTTPGMRGKMKKTLVASAAGSDHLWTGGLEGEIDGFRAIATNQVSRVMATLEATGGAQHGIIFGDWSALMVGFWGALELIVDPYTYKKQALIEVASFQQADIQIRTPESFCVSTGATIA